MDLLWGVVTQLVVFSVIVHGFSAVPFTWLLWRVNKGVRKELEQAMEQKEKRMQREVYVPLSFFLSPPLPPPLSLIYFFFVFPLTEISIFRYPYDDTKNHINDWVAGLLQHFDTWRGREHLHSEEGSFAYDNDNGSEGGEEMGEKHDNEE